LRFKPSLLDRNLISENEKGYAVRCSRLEPDLELDNPTITRDLDLVDQARAGDKAAFEQLYRANVGRIYALCLRISANSLRAQELTQDAFVRAWEMLGTFRGESAFSSWLYRLAVNVALLDLRSQRRRTARVLVTNDLSFYDKEEKMAMPENEIDLENAIAALPPQARAIFVLHDVEGYQHDEIAELMELSVGTSKSQLHRARKLLREALER
jgi:RNA polymerase sigma-70 factor (ECF subfamily)